MNEKHIKLYDEFCQLFEEYNNENYSFNILKVLQGNIVENSHTNILTEILKYKNGNKYPFLESFCKYVFPYWSHDLSGEIQIVTEQTVKDEKGNINGRMDAWIHQKDEFSIIIENKINGACDQKKQLNRYIRSEKKKIDKNKIWIVYITRNGGEPNKEECESLKSELECGVIEEDKECHVIYDKYAAISYDEHILPWLKDCVLPNIMMKHITLYNGVSQYVDFLETLLSVEQIPKTVLEKTTKEIEKYLSGKKTFKGKIKALHGFFSRGKNTRGKENKYSIFLSIIDSYRKSFTEDFAKITYHYFSNVFNTAATDNNLCKIHSHFCNYYINIYNSAWGRNVFFSWSPNSLDVLEKGKNLTFSVVCNCKEMLDELQQIPELKDGFKPADKLPSTLRKQVEMSKPIYGPYNEKETDALEKTYKDLVPESLIKKVNVLMAKYYPSM